MKPETLDRYESLFAPPGRAYDSFLRRRSRKQRNRRIGAFVLAFVIAAGSVAAALDAFHRSSEPKPVNTIDPASVSRLHEIASRLTFPQEGFRMATGDGVLVVGTSRFRSQRGQLIAYPFPCGDAGVACMPLWRASLDGAGSPVVANGVVYATGRGGRTLYAFAAHCGSNGRECSPRWTADVGATGWVTPPIVVPQGSTNRVYVGTERAVLGFDVGCADGGGACSPAWSAAMGQPVRAIASSGGVLFAGTGKTGAPRPGRYRFGHRTRYVLFLRVIAGSSPLPVMAKGCRPGLGSGRSTAARWSSARTVARRECRPIRSRASAPAHRAGRRGSGRRAAVRS